MRGNATYAIAGAVVGTAIGLVTVFVYGYTQKRRNNLLFLHDASQLTRDEVLRIRQQHFCAAQSVSYANTSPLMLTRGEGQYLFSDDGTAYLDSRNNVPHVGHGHPKVVAAVQQQVAAINTNTRYLHPLLCLLAKKLLATLPKELDTCFFVNSGSEANDLAIRLARAHTGNNDIIVVDRAYHGHTAAVIDISPYKYNKLPNGQKPHVHQVPCPDTYRGAHKEADAAAAYASYVNAACVKTGGRVCAFFIESGMSVAGVVVPPPEYLKRCYDYVRRAGGVCVADEVQVGFGRTGDHFWGFQQQGVVPDIVTMGKPFGNGMPLAAVVTTRAIAQSFAGQKVEYFNTFGGNPVCAAAGLAVLEVIEEEGLQRHALEVGKYMQSRLLELAAKRNLIGDVRGSGLFLGIELVRNQETLEPATAETSAICSRMKERHHILTSVDGAHDNVLVVKPPMCFNKGNVDTFVEALDECLGAMQELDLTLAMHTPT